MFASNCYVVTIRETTLNRYNPFSPSAFVKNGGLGVVDVSSGTVLHSVTFTSACSNHFLTPAKALYLATSFTSPFLIGVRRFVWPKSRSVLSFVVSMQNETVVGTLYFAHNRNELLANENLPRICEVVKTVYFKVISQYLQSTSRCLSIIAMRL